MRGTALASTRFTNARLVDGTGERRGSLVIEDGRIAKERGQACACTFDLGGLALMPAFVDTHCHLRDPGWPEKETMESGMLAALSGGFATLCAMANTNPVCETAEQVEANLYRAERLGLCNLVQAAAAGKGLGDTAPTDWAALSAVTRVLSNDGKTIESDAFMEQLLRASAKYGFLVSTHCQPERATVKRDLALLGKTGGRLHVGHISRLETAGMIRAAKKAGLPVSCEVMPHHVFGYDNDYRVNPPMRSRADAAALIEAIADGTVDCLATDHAPHTEEDKAAGAAGICNMEHAAGMFWQVFTQNGLPLTLLSRLLSQNPAQLLGTGTGLLRPDDAADLVVFDPDAKWSVQRARMRSRSHNTPFEGRALRGRVRMTIVKGEIRYDHRQTLS